MVNENYDVGEALEAVEDELIASMIRNLRRHKVEEHKEEKQWSQWQVEQLKCLERYKAQNKEKYGSLFKDINANIEDAIREMESAGEMEQEIAILKSLQRGVFGYSRAPDSVTGEFFRTNSRKLEALIQATTNDMKTAETAILRMANDKYRSVIFNAQVYAATGAGTYEKAVDMATKDMLAAGLNCVEYKNGSRHGLAEYAEMALRTANKRAYLQGEGQKRAEYGVYTVIMNKRSCPCPKCLPFVGKVMIDDVWSGGPKSGISPVTGVKYPLMSGAISAGIFHPNCKDHHTTYYEGISTPPSGSAYTKEELQKLKEEYKQEQKQQYAERQQKKFERLSKYSLDKGNQKKYAARADQWKKVVEKVSVTDIIHSGARITDPFSKEGKYHAERMYPEIRSYSTDAKKIAENLEMQETEIRKIKAYLFENKSYFDPDKNMWRRFDPDCAIAQSWQRLMVGKDIKHHDRVLIQHELYEMEVKKSNPGISHDEAHRIASEKFNYSEEVEKYYGSLEKHSENG